MLFLVASVTALLLACRVQAAAVFAHFMLTNTANYTSTDWQDDMKLAQDAHIDAFALNMAYDDPTNIKALPAAFAAADSVGFKLFFSFDYAGNGDWPKNDVINLIKQYSTHSSYFFYKGKAFVSTFEGPGRANDWNLIKASTNCFFVPSWSSIGAKPAVETDVVDGLFSWAAWPWGNQDMSTYIDASYIQYLAGLPYMMPVSPWFYTNLPGYKKNWLWRGDHIWHDRWQEVLYVQPEFVEIITWNDYGESHYIGPLRDRAMEAFEIGKAPFNYATDMPHDGWRETLPYWIDMYKNGFAEVTEEKIIAWYRTTPAAACGSGGTSGNTASQLQIEFPPADLVEDRIFFSAVLGSFSGAVVSIGGDAQTVGWSFVPEDNVGVYFGSVAFGGRTGPVTVSLMRDNVIIATVKGKSISGSCPNGIQNWNAWVGSAITGRSVSAQTTVLLMDQKCMNGTGSYNFGGLCEYACSYGYCPLGACTCTKMGIGNQKPNSTGVVGYPIAGEGASYSGLCNFDCNLGFCPPTACGLVEVPLSTPSVSPFLPPACTAGTGAGNLAGLCSFSCGHGFCPMNACTCTAQGAVNVMSPTTKMSGQAAPGQDPAIYGPLCEYTCQRGYCPEGACVPHAGSSTGSGSGSHSGDGDVYISPSIWGHASPVIQCEPPCSIILPPIPLETPSIIEIPPWVIPVEQSRTRTRTSTGEDGTTTTYHGYNVTTITITVTIPDITLHSIPLWGVSVNGSQTANSTITLTSSVSLPHIVYVLPPVQGDPTSTRSTTTLIPPPYPWSQIAKETGANSKTPTPVWTSGPPTPTVSKGSPGAGKSCAPFCRGPCLLCPPAGADTVGGSGGGSDGSEENCSTDTAEVCSTACVAGSECTFDCTTTTGCSVTASSTKIVGTPAPGVAITMSPHPAETPDPSAALSIASELEPTLASKFGTLSVISGALSSPTPTGAAPMNGPYPGVIILSYYVDKHSGVGQWDLYQTYSNGPGRDTCPEVDKPDFVMKDGAFFGIHDGTGGFKAFGSTCTYKGTSLPGSSDPSEATGRFVCDGYRDADCHGWMSDGGSCSQGWLEHYTILECRW
ncbi:Glucan endo-1,3-alpha-glucosidase [Penicillium ucsense]|uniref:Glucan endo-1,3-alpha-glucosidase n=1 Tax=Penicillium ucsense TaxID=2839758 RepID=A0A8J8WGB5_9EURO|nr:Glucan endo-1,3-alpha-glucosidase [Penicillium ucsense]KAF7722350.1 Glucan endo-1,3-alpha-glucosidase [Penicillium ucsense]